MSHKSASSDISVCLVIPARNEEDVISKMIRMTLAVYPQYIKHVVAVDDGSTDKTAEIIKDIARCDKRVIPVIRHAPHGVGLAIREGISNVPASDNYVLLMDADFIRNIPDLENFFETIGRYDGLIGSRYLEPHSLIRYPALKKFFNRAFHLLAKIIFNIRLHDMSNNFKLYKRTMLQSLPLKSTDFAVNAETGIYPVLMGYKIGEIPVTWYARERDMGVSKFRLLSIAPGYAKVLLYASNLSSAPIPRLIRKIYNIILL